MPISFKSAVIFAENSTKMKTHGISTIALSTTCVRQWLRFLELPEKLLLKNVLCLLKTILKVQVAALSFYLAEQLPVLLVVIQVRSLAMILFSLVANTIPVAQ